MESLSASSTSNDWRDSRSAPAAAQAFNPSMQQLSEHHYNYVEPSPSTFASPTDSSPSSSPQAFERRRHSANNASLFLAQHTSAVPISIDPLDATGPVWPSHSSELRYSPPLRYSLVPQSMEYAVASPLSSYPYPPAAGPNAFGHYGDATTMGSLNRRRLTAHPFHHPQPPHFYESGGAGYWTMVQEQEQEPYHHQVGDYHGSRLQVWAQEQQHQHHHQQQDQSGYSQMMDSRPQLLLATSMPTSAPIVIDEPSLVHATAPTFHQYDAPSRADLSSPTHTLDGSNTTTRANLPAFSASLMHRAAEPTQAYVYGPGMDLVENRYRTNMDICSYENAHIPHQGGPIFTAPRAAPPTYLAQPHLIQSDESKTASPITSSHDQGQTINHDYIPLHAAVLAPGTTAAVQQQEPQNSNQLAQYAHIGNHLGLNNHGDLQKEGISGPSESNSCTNTANGTRGTPHRTTTKEAGLDGDSSQTTTSRPPSREQSVHIKMSPDSSAPALCASMEINVNPESNSANEMLDSVAVAPLLQSTALEFQSRDERFDRTRIDRRVNDGAVNSTNGNVGLNGTGTTIKTPKLEEEQIAPQQPTILDKGTPASEPTTPSGLVHNHSNVIDRSHSLSLHTTDTSSNIAEMQVISHSREQDSQGYSNHPIYPFTKPSYNQHVPTISSLLRPEWRRNSQPEYGINHQPQGSDGSVSSDARHSYDYEDGHALPLAHRNSLPNLPLAADHRSPQEIGSAHHSPSPAPPGYYVPGERLVPAAFGNASSSHGSGSSASSTPPTIPHDASVNPAQQPHYRYEPTMTSQMTQQSTTLYDSPREQKVHYEPAYPTVFNPGAPGAPSFNPRPQNPMLYGSYPPQGYGHHYDHRASSSSPAPPMIAGTKRGREEDWADETEASRELQRRRSSYSQSAAMIMGGLAYRNASASPSIQSAEMGVIRVAGYAPSLKDMGVRDLTGEPQQVRMGIERYANGRRPGEDAIRSGSDTSYSFISLPGNTVRKRPRRKFEEITRNYVCIWPGCSKAYGTLNHLNAHVTMQKHGSKRVPSEFKELRKVWRKQKREQQQQQQQHGVHHHGMQNDGSEYFHDEDREEDDDGSVYNGVDIAQ